jgi:hypothetical protein
MNIGPITEIGRGMMVVMYIVYMYKNMTIRSAIKPVVLSIRSVTLSNISYLNSLVERTKEQFSLQRRLL